MIHDRIYAREEALARTALALDGAVAFLKELESYVNYEYELPRVYHAAIPDFAYGKSSSAFMTAAMTINFRCDGELGLNSLQGAILDWR